MKKYFTIITFIFVLIVPIIAIGAQLPLKAPWKGLAQITQTDTGDPMGYKFTISFIDNSSDILALDDGFVSDVSRDNGGSVLTITHSHQGEDEYFSSYANLNEIIKQNGTEVKQGEVIAKSGASFTFTVWNFVPVTQQVMLKRKADCDNSTDGYFHCDLSTGDLNFTAYGPGGKSLDNATVAGKWFYSNNGVRVPQVPLKAPFMGKARMYSGNFSPTTHNTWDIRGWEHGFLISWSTGTPQTFYYFDKPFDHSYAIDFELPFGADVLASASGHVVYSSGADGLRGWGGVTLAIETSTGDGTTFTTLYCHLASRFVQLGDNVTQGDVIASSGASAFGSMMTMEPHLHYAILGAGAILGDDTPDDLTAAPFEQLWLKQEGVDFDFAPYGSEGTAHCSDPNDPINYPNDKCLDHASVWGKWFESNNAINDSDLDGIGDTVDNCPAIANLQQKDGDTDGIGDVCDTTPGCGEGCGQVMCEQDMDKDKDFFRDAIDNCPTMCNLSQLDADSDGIGDVCDPTPGCGGGCGQVACEEVCTP